MPQNEISEGKEIIRDATIESTLSEEASPLTESKANKDVAKRPAKTQASSNKISPQKKSAPKKKVTSKKKAAPKKQAMPKKKAAPRRSASKQVTTRPVAGGASSAQTKPPVTAEDVSPASSPTRTETQTSVAPTPLKNRAGVWFSATLVVLVGVAAYIWYRPTDTSENAAAETQTSVETGQTREQTAETEASQSIATADSAPPDKPPTEEYAAQVSVKAPNALTTIEHTESDTVSTQSPTKDGAISTPSERAAQTSGLGMGSQDPLLTHPATESASTLEQASAGIRLVPRPEAQASSPETSTDQPPGAITPEISPHNIEFNKSAINQQVPRKAETEAVTLAPLAPSVTQKETQTVTVRPAEPAATGFQQIPEAISSENRTAVAEKIPPPPKATTPDSRREFSTQPPSPSFAGLPNYRPPMRQHYRGMPPPYSWNNPYGAYGRVIPYSMGPHYFSYRHPPPQTKENTK